MKNKTFTLVFLVLLFACRSVDKMVEKGDYEGAFKYSISKLEGEKNKETKYVKALEKAFVKLQASSHKEIERLDAERKSENWPRVNQLYRNLEARQDQLEPLLPLKSEDGYRANFEIKNYRQDIEVSEENTCKYYYKNANELMIKSDKSGDKIYARQAYDELKKIDKFKRNYKDAEKLKEEAISLGQTRIYFDVLNNLRDFNGIEIEREIKRISVSKMDDFWHRHFIGDPKTDKYADFAIIVDLNEIIYSPDHERLNSYVDQKEILVRTEKVREKRDTVYVWVEKEVYERVKAEVSEIYREKRSELHGKLRMFEIRNNDFYKSTPINIYHDFKGYGCKYFGEYKALTPESIKKLDDFCEPFPTNGNMAEIMTNAFKTAVLEEMKKLRYD